MDIEFTYEQVKYQVDQETWKAARTYIAPDAAQQRAEAATTASLFDAAFVRHRVTEAVARLHDLLHKFITDVAIGRWERTFPLQPQTALVYYGFPETADADDLGSDTTDTADPTLLDRQSWEKESKTPPAAWKITFRTDYRRNVIAQLLLADILRYATLYVLTEWARLAHPQLQENYIQQLADVTTRLQRAMMRKEAPMLDDN